MIKRHYRPALWLVMWAGIVAAGNFEGLAQGQAGGGTVSRDGAALIFRKPENPATNAASGSSQAAGGGRLSRGVKSRAIAKSRAAAVAQNKIIARGNAARSAPQPRYSEAAEQYQLAARQDPEDARAHAGLGNVYLDQERFSDAVGAYANAITLKPDYLPAYQPLVYSLVRLNRYEEATDRLKQALQHDPNNAELYNNLAFTYVHSELYGEAVEAGKQAILLLNQTEKAYQQGLQTRIEVLSNAYKNLGNAYNGLHQYDEAAAVLKQATQIEPTNVAAQFNLGLALYNARRYPEAIEAYKACVNLRPQLAVAHYNLGLAYVAINDHVAAQQVHDILKPLNANMATQLQSLIKR